ncbi:septal ring lytic transglycosylase RlpA family protein [Permianibacter sp. IMCC34836]|uniref:septal ring lytic transglycosylase RlpA family protein n=1 Tax=Permianibacter fluminis TaxID=2738515 RepID=UPI001556D5BA|nr:septal ring lytic transglycosylase RlpA family protein [Permianibacter fluminis]NQD36635.1 septal ring lytic transglycosylase RlpA family protein [Permianibacter fluminis]
MRDIRAAVHGGVLAISFLLMACSSSPTKDEADSGPDVPPDLRHVQEPVPRKEPRSRFGNPESYTVLGETYHVLDSAEGFSQRGIASWYGNKFHGKRTSSGEPYDMYKMTAAHKTLPIPVHVRVTNLDNGKSIIVRVNDRGPFKEGRIIDLSYAAAHKLGMTGTGTARVEISALTGDDDSTATNTNATGSSAGTAPRNTTTSAAGDEGLFFVQIASFRNEDSADEVAAQVQPLVGYPVKVFEADTDDGRVYRVRVGPLSRRDYAEKVRDHLEGKGYERPAIVGP